MRTGAGPSASVARGRGPGRGFEISRGGTISRNSFSPALSEFWRGLAGKIPARNRLKNGSETARKRLRQVGKIGSNSG